MSDNPTINDQAQGDVSQLNTAPAQASVEKNLEALSLDELNGYLNKNYPTREAALKSIKDTFSYVGKKREDVEKEVSVKFEETLKYTDNVAKELENLRKEMFYRDNPEYNAHRGLIDKLGKNPAEVVTQQEFKDIFEKAKGFEQSQSLKTVLESSPTIRASRDSLQKASEAINKGDPDTAANIVSQNIRNLYNL